MPNYQTNHWTDGDGIENKLVGNALRERLSKLKSDANDHHSKCQQQSKSALNHAKEAGEALLEVKRRLGHRSKGESTWGQPCCPQLFCRGDFNSPVELGCLGTNAKSEQQISRFQ